MHIKIVGCGGTGTEIVKLLQQCKFPNDHAPIEYAIVDTSRSNLGGLTTDTKVFIIPGVNGSGGNRAENINTIRQHLPAIMNTIEPGEFTIVIGSITGGSGSVIAPLYHGECIGQEVPTVGLIIGSSESQRRLANGDATWKTYAGVCAAKAQPLVLHYAHNQGGNQQVANEATISIVHALSILCNDNNARLDTKDIENWLFYNRVTKAPPRVVLLDLATSITEANEIVDPISVVTLNNKVGYDVEFKNMPDYSTLGHTANLLGADELHFILSADGVETCVAEMRKASDDVKAAKNARVNASSMLTAKTVVEADGFVLE